MDDAKQGFAADGETDLAIRLAAPSQLDINGDRAYAVFPTVISSKRRGKTATENGAFAFALDTSGSGWHIVSWTWATL